MVDKLEFLQRVNDSGADAAVGNIVQLIAEGFTVMVEPSTLVGLDGEEDLPAFTVTTLKDGETHGEGTNTWLMEAVADAYMLTPEAA